MVRPKVRAAMDTLFASALPVLVAFAAVEVDDDEPDMEEDEDAAART
jgi:hypothetical protein